MSDQPRREWVTLWCERGHDHVCAAEQVDRILRDPCPWCGTPLRPSKP